MPLPAILATAGRYMAAGGAAAGRAAGAAGSAALDVGAAIGADLAADITNHLQSPIAAVTNDIRKFEQALFSWERPLKALEGLFQHIGHYTSKFNPYYMERFNLAVSDLEAVIGEAMVPALEEGTQLIRDFADVLVYMQPALKELVHQGISFVKFVGGALLGPGGQWALDTILAQSKGASVAKSFQPARTTNVQSALTEIQQRAFSMGGKPADQRTADASERIAQILEIVIGAMGGTNNTTNVYKN